jgi:hypothetical protein
MIVLDSHESYLSATFEEFCKEKNIITLCLPAYFSYLTQPFDVSCFSILKYLYSKELEAFIKAHINYITKIEFFIIFKATHISTMIAEDIQSGFCSAGLVLYNPQAILSKLDIKLQIPTPTRSPLLEANP